MKKEIIEFKWFTDKQALSEIYQSVDMKFALAGKNDNIIMQAHPWVKCRDFLHDAIRSQITGIESLIYGFNYDPNDDKFPKISTDKTLLFISQQTIDDVKIYRDHLSRALVLVHHYENIVGVANSTLKKIPLRYMDGKETYNHVWLFEGDVFWLSAPYMISMLTFLLRLGSKLPRMTSVESAEKVYKTIIDKYEKEWEKTPNMRKDNDVVYLKECYNKLSKLVSMKEKLVSVHGEGPLSIMYDSKISIGTFHNQTGILSACKGITWNKAFNSAIEKVF